MKHIFLSFLITIFMAIPCNVSAQNNDAPVAEAPSADYVAAIDKFLEVSGSKETMKAQFSVLMNALKNMLSNIPEDVFAKIEAKYRELFINRMVEFIAPTYKYYFTLEELKNCIAFYETDLGRKVAKVNPTLINDLGAFIMYSIIAELKSKGFDTKGL
ncbi:DUF2059 domain-containing protein [Prevotella pallens]|jgi:hypothetical protein|uniref:DUF2059 domain-containing protein n=1 Tax=Prevotella pallens TaxID=60133 RepID=UPI001CB6562D|nr:DUF2059 domain-containing protein [Prevotella pallens]MBF1475944.1 DUF2059 domain-containing protein [Prevotella pallens]